MTDRYEKIHKALAMGPTPGPWGVRYDYVVQARAYEDGRLVPVAQPYGVNCDGTDLFANALLIAACDPDAAQALLDERDALEAENERLRAEIERLRADEEGHAITAIKVTLFGRACYLPADIAQEVEQACVAHALAQQRGRCGMTAPVNVLALLERSLAVIQHDIDEIGGCDHSVGICCCELIHLADDIRAALAAMGGQPETEESRAIAALKVTLFGVELLKPTVKNYGLYAEHNMPCCVFTDRPAVFDCNTGIFHPSRQAQAKGWRLVRADSWFQHFLLRHFFGDPQ